MKSKEWIDNLEDISLPRWNDLPEIPLYLDQVLEYVNGKIGMIFKEKETLITAAMINNYVKHKLMPPPKKKKYNRGHLAYIIAISFIKQIITIPQISAAIEQQTEYFGGDVAYDNFIDSLENSIKVVVARYKNKNIDSEITALKDERLNVLNFAAMSFASKIMSEYLLEKMASEKEKKNGK